MQKLTKEQAIIISCYTGITACNFALIQEAVEKKLGRSVFTHEFGSQALADKIAEAFREDFLAICFGDE